MPSVNMHAARLADAAIATKTNNFGQRHAGVKLMTAVKRFTFGVALVLHLSLICCSPAATSVRSELPLRSLPTTILGDN
jgi:hypothetical protein